LDACEHVTAVIADLADGDSLLIRRRSHSSTVSPVRLLCRAAGRCAAMLTYAELRSSKPDVEESPEVCRSGRRAVLVSRGSLRVVDWLCGRSPQHLPCDFVLFLTAGEAWPGSSSQERHRRGNTRPLADLGGSGELVGAHTGRVVGEALCGREKRLLGVCGRDAQSVSDPVETVGPDVGWSAASTSAASGRARWLVRFAKRSSSSCSPRGPVAASALMRAAGPCWVRRPAGSLPGGKSRDCGSVPRGVSSQ
jgi:hypothetical protein